MARRPLPQRAPAQVYERELNLDPVAPPQVVGPNQVIHQPLMPVTREVLYSALNLAPFALDPLPPWVRHEVVTSLDNCVDLYQDRPRSRRSRLSVGLVARADPSKLQR